MTIGDDEMRREREREAKKKDGEDVSKTPEMPRREDFFRKITQMPPSLQRRANISVV